MRKLLLAGSLVAALAPAAARAQLTLSAADARLRVVVADPTTALHGDVSGGAPFRLLGAPISMPQSTAMLAAIRAEGSDTTNSASRGARNGFLVGAVLGFTTAYLICDGASCRSSKLERLRYALIAAVVDGGIGALIGWKIGSR